MSQKEPVRIEKYRITVAQPTTDRLDIPPIENISLRPLPKLAEVNAVISWPTCDLIKEVAPPIKLKIYQKWLHRIEK